MNKHHVGGPGWALAAVCAAITFAAAPVHAVPITMTYLQQAGFKATSGLEGGDGANDAALAGQGGLEFFTRVPAGPPSLNSPSPPDTWKGVAWGCGVSSGQCANGGTVANATVQPAGYPSPGAPFTDQQGNTDRSVLYMQSTAGTLTDTFQPVTTIKHYNRPIQHNFLEGVDINLFLRLGPSELILGGPSPRVFKIDFFESFNTAGTCGNASNQPPTGTNAPINPLGTQCDDYAVVAGLDLASVFLPANSPFGNTVPAIIDFQLGIPPFDPNNPNKALVCNGQPGQPQPACSTPNGPYSGPDVIVYTGEGSTNTITIDARIRGNIPDTRPLPLFVIGDVEPHALGNVVNFWGSQWWKNNDMSGFVANGVASFKGYASNANDFCGGLWQSRPGNSSDPPSSIPDDVAIIVTDTVTKQGPNIGGTIKQILIVHHDGNYGPAPGHRGGGPVTQILCTSP